ncbi:MAG: MogA/MoaB family molybdenum cofactor biosynthesis protein, partial [Planctomycetota bacterium]
MRAAVLTISDRCASGQRSDESGPVVEELLINNGIEVSEREIVPDECDKIVEILKHFSDNAHADMVLTTGGTGLGPRDVTPEATQLVCEKMVPGLGEA